MPASVRNAKLSALDGSRRGSRPDIVPSRDSDIALVAETIAAVAEWLADPHGPSSLQLPSGNSYQRALQHQTLKSKNFGTTDPPGFYSTKVIDEEGKTALRLIRASSAQVKEYVEGLRRQKEVDINAAGAFVAVFEAMRDCKKPAVGHNISFDLSYSLHSFARPLPPTWQGYKALVRRWFPGGVYDTKYITRQFPEAFPETGLGELYTQLMGARLGSSSLTTNSDGMRRTIFGGGGGGGDEIIPTTAEPEQEVEQQEENSEPPAAAAALLLESSSSVVAAVEALKTAFSNVDVETALPPIRHAPGFDRYRNGGDDDDDASDVQSVQKYAHEAGYDAFMTGAVFASLLSLLPRSPVSFAGAEFYEDRGGGEEEESKKERMNDDDDDSSEYGPAAEGGMEEREEDQGDAVGTISTSPPTTITKTITPTSTTTTTTTKSTLDLNFSPSTECVDEYCWRMNLSRTDIEYAALQGPDVVPPRRNILYLKNLDVGRFRHGGEVLKKLNLDKERVGGFVKVSLLGDDGGAALLQLPTEDEGVIEEVSDAVRAMLPGCVVSDFEGYRMQKAMNKMGMYGGDGGEEMEVEEIGAERSKRARKAGGGGDKEGVVAGSSRCSIM